jgi:amidase
VPRSRRRNRRSIFGELSYLTNARLIPRNQFELLLQKSKELDEKEQGPDSWYARTVTKTYRDWQILNEERAIARQKWADFFKEYDVLLSPAVRIAAFPHDHTELSERMTKFNDQKIKNHFAVISPWAALASVVYLPATVAPIGLTSDGLPIGVQIIGPYMEDRTSIHFSKLIEDNLGGFNPPPGFQ